MPTPTTDRFAFLIVTTAAEIQAAAKDGHVNVKVVCPQCGKQLLRTIGAALFIIQYACKQHN